MPVTTFRTGLKLAVEASRGVAPTASQWYNGGRWFDIVTDGMPGLQNQKAIIFPQGHAGRRSRNQQPPVDGRKWSDGDFSANVTADFIGALLRGAFGSLSTNSVPSTDASLLENEALIAGSKALVLTSQPSDGGAILRFNVQGTSAAGEISISGIDVYGNGASEVITFASGGYHYSRTSFSSIAASGIEVTSNNTGDLTIEGFKYWEHIFSASDQDPTLSIERHGNPMTGNASASTFMHTGMVVQELGFETAAADREGIFMMNATVEGDFGATCAAQTLNHASAMRIWPAWSLNVTRDGVNYHKVTNATINYDTGNRNYRAAAGTQNPQGSFFGGREATGSFDVLVDDAGEYDRWLGLSATEFNFRWEPSWKLTSSDNYRMEASLTQSYIESMDESDDDDALSLGIDFRPIDDADNNISKWTLRNGTPGTAYGGDVP